MNQSIHIIDLLQWYMGPVDTVFAFADTLLHKRIEVEDTAVAVLRFKSGAVGVIEGTTSVYPGYKTRIELTGENGTVIFEDGIIKSCDLKDETGKTDMAAHTGHAGKSGAQDPMDISFKNHQDLFEDFINSVREKKEFWIDAKESRKAVEIILAIYESARAGKPVKLG
jgi:predicted dehydrogenase